MKPHGWRESVTPEQTTLRFAQASFGRRVAFVLVVLPLWVIGVSMTIASIHEGNWGGGYCIVAGWDALAMLMGLVALDQWSRTRIVFESGHVTWKSGPFPRSSERMTFVEAATIAAEEHTARRARYWAFSFLRDGSKKRLGSALDDADRAQYVLERLDAELVRRDPELRTPRMTSGLS